MCDEWSTTENIGWMRDIRKPYLPNGGISFLLSSYVQRPGHYSEVISVPPKLDLLKDLLLSCLSYGGQLSQPGCKGRQSPQNLKPSKLGETLRDHLGGIRDQSHTTGGSVGKIAKEMNGCRPSRALGVISGE